MTAPRPAIHPSAHASTRGFNSPARQRGHLASTCQGASSPSECAGVCRTAASDTLALTEENVEAVLDEVSPTAIWVSTSVKTCLTLVKSPLYQVHMEHHSFDE
jgi:hypothetical protein